MKLKSILKVVGLTTLAGLTLAACVNTGGSSSDNNTLRVGLMAKSDSEEKRWEKIEELLEKEGVKLEYTEFTDYSQPNIATANGDVDLNAFQHYNFLDNWNEENKGDLVAIADTIISPIRLYSGTKDGKNRYTSVDQIPDGATITVPNDATNESRALYLLQSAGLIKLDVSGKELATIANVKENPKKLDIKELDASQTARSLDSADAAVVNNTFVSEAGLDFKKALFVEVADENSQQWYNILAAKSDWEKSDKADALKKLIKAYHTDDVKKVIEETSEGLDQPVW
ncbi:MULTISPECIES: MetQ/NlpA family ABC transporter substrate-binding protein [unclassified Streptococcus]|uniref:MetQ/NlpA family ABC transporter substrate-binding protein n=1 Tax=unclassified Streptococcus TaxID=2608887 RepID=UPI001072747B|nr:MULTISPECIES: MetQ/NlpA family ABC transporter substrate-binding protein [unclassified Streptococcus]MBF0806165.1 MetQ/NlpA family ABC transporter substrate-binding protein [Streptococcus sp. 19428wA2_WM07]TFU28229.1 MetQ/NlpA family ABC transporter substrate-binding protein [Streptococcus sp. WM07]